MNAYVFLFATCEVASYQFEDINVGTVLFSSSDIIKKRWSATEIGLLRARRHFQSFIPPPDMINTNEDFINSLIGYFKDSYSSVKSEVKDPKTDSIMNAALSDTLGGYLKAWVLPVTKFAYYGGTVSQEDAMKLFQLYDEIKQSLNTNGSSWRSPINNLLNSVSINIVSIRSTTPRDVSDPCDSLAYFEKSNTGLAIPVPNVNWSNNSASLFVPLKNQSLIPLTSSYNESLVKYYNAATNCIEASKLEDQNQFNTRFQNWLTDEILPHLNDEQFYPALGSVLSLVNKTRNLVDTVIDLYGETSPAVNRSTIIGIAVDLSSKKMMIISVIIILEAAWCIPTLCFLLCRKIRRNKKKSVYVYVAKGKGKNGNQNLSKTGSTQYSLTECGFKETETSCKESVTKNRHEMHTQKSRQQGVNLVSKPQSKSCIVETRHSNVSFKPRGTSTKSNIFQTSSLADTFVHDRPIHPRHGSFKKCLVNDIDIQKSSTSREVYSCVPDKNYLDKTNSLTTTPQLELTKTVTLLKENNKINEIAEINKDEETQITEETSLETIDASINSCRCCQSIYCAKQTKSTEKSVKNISVPVPLTKPDSKTVRLKNQKNVTDSKSRGGLKLSSGNPCLEITIDRPQRKISVDFTQTQARALIPRQSRIPKRAHNNREAQTTNVATKKTQSPSYSKCKSFIPQPKRQKTVDDIIIKNKKTSTENDSLNRTL